MKNQREIIRFIVIIGFIISGFIILITHIDNITLLFSKIIRALIPFFYGLLFAYLLDPLTKKIELKTGKRLFSVFISETLFIVILVLTGFIIIPQLTDSISSIINKVNNPGFIEDLKLRLPILTKIFGEKFERTDIALEFINKHMLPEGEESLTSYISLQIKNIFVNLVNIIIGIVVSVLLLLSREKLTVSAKKVLYALFSQKIVLTIEEEAENADKIFHGFFYGKLLDSIIIFIICLISLYIFKIPYAVLIAFIVGITNIVPVIGPFIGAIPGFLLIFPESIPKAFGFLIFILILQQIDGHIIGPKCIASSTGLDTFWVLFAILFFGKIWGFIGFILGVPVFACIYDIISKIVNIKLEEKGFKSKKKE